MKLPSDVTKIELATAITSYVECHDAYLQQAQYKIRDTKRLETGAPEARYPEAKKRLWALAKKIAEVN